MEVLSLAVHFTSLDWAVLVGYLALTTLLGAWLAGRQATIRDFFLGGRKLPWPAVAGSIVATEISAVTFISAPAIVFAAGGDLTYLQLMLGALLARLIIAVWFVPAFYEREIYSPYDYAGMRLGAPARTVTTGLFMLGAVLGQSVRVLLTAVILEVITGIPLAWSIWIVGAVSVGWTLLGGIAIVIWTDVIQFFVFVAALAGVLIYVLASVDGGWDAMMAAAQGAGKLRLWDLSADPQRAFTLWAALLGNTLLCLNAYGTDQMIAQRMFCCKGRREASLAIIASSVGLLVTVLAMFVGLGLFAFYQQHPLAPELAARVATDRDLVFPIFIVQQIPAGLTGLIIAGVFAAAISSLDSVLAALSQTVVTGFYRPWRRAKSELRRANNELGDRADESEIRSSPFAIRNSPGRHNPPAAADCTDADPAEARRDMLASKLLVVFWGVVLCLMASVAELARQHYRDILNLALAMATYTGGATLAAFLLALLRLNVDYRGLVWSAPLSVLMVFAVSWHQPWAQWTTIALACVIFAAWVAHLLRSVSYWAVEWWRDAPKTGYIVLGCGAAVFVSLFEYGPPDARAHLSVAWPWNVPIGFVVAFSLGYLLGRREGPIALLGNG